MVYKLCYNIFLEVFMKHKLYFLYFLTFLLSLFIVSCSDDGGNSQNSCQKDTDCNENQICISKKCISNNFLCQNKKCSNHGECIVINGSATCECEEGYISQGLSCVEAPCIKNSECGTNEICDNGECKDQNILCENINCGNGSCVVENKTAGCKCNEGYIEENLHCIENKCENVECSVIEVCNNETGECEVVTNPCDGINCGEHGECVYDRDGNASCECENGYIDKNKECIFEIPCVKTADTDNCNDGFDNNCDGIINDNCSCNSGDELSCYTGDTSKIGTGECKAGTLSCIGGENWGNCTGEILPAEETCDGKDNDCDGKTDLTPSGEILSKKCYTGDITQTQHPNSRCKEGRYECKGGNYDKTNCIDEVLPLDTEICGNSIDDNCDGRIDEDCVAPLVTCSNDIPRAYLFEAPVHLSAEATDSNGTVVSTSWSFFAKPAGTASVLNPETGNRTQFIPDTVGEYIARFTATDNDGEKSYCDIHISAKTRDHLNVTLTWDKGGNSDMDLHLLMPGADSSKWNTASDCFWAVSNPDWGDRGVTEDNPRLDRDDTSGFGPEVIQIESPKDGKYTVGVDYFDAQGQGPSVATIKIICNGEEHIYTSEPLNPKDKWAVIDIVWADETCTLEPASRSF